MAVETHAVERESVEAIREATREILRRIGSDSPPTDEERRAFAKRVVEFQRAGGFAMQVECRRCHARYPLVAASSAVMRTLYQETCCGCGRERSIDETRHSKIVRSTKKVLEQR